MENLKFCFVLFVDYNLLDNHLNLPRATAIVCLPYRLILLSERK